MKVELRATLSQFKEILDNINQYQFSVEQMDKESSDLKQNVGDIKMKLTKFKENTTKIISKIEESIETIQVYYQLLQNIETWLLDQSSKLIVPSMQINNLFDSETHLNVHSYNLSELKKFKGLNQLKEQGKELVEKFQCNSSQIERQFNNVNDSYIVLLNKGNRIQEQLENAKSKYQNYESTLNNCEKLISFFKQNDFSLCNGNFDKILDKKNKKKIGYLNSEIKKTNMIKEKIENAKTELDEAVLECNEAKASISRPSSPDNVKSTETPKRETIIRNQLDVFIENVTDKLLQLNRTVLNKNEIEKEFKSIHEWVNNKLEFENEMSSFDQEEQIDSNLLQKEVFRTDKLIYEIDHKFSRLIELKDKFEKIDQNGKDDQEETKDNDEDENGQDDQDEESSYLETEEDEEEINEKVDIKNIEEKLNKLLNEVKEKNESMKEKLEKMKQFEIVLKELNELIDGCLFLSNISDHEEFENVFLGKFGEYDNIEDVINEEIIPRIDLISEDDKIVYEEKLNIIKEKLTIRQKLNEEMRNNLLLVDEELNNFDEWIEEKLDLISNFDEDNIDAIKKEIDLKRNAILPDLVKRIESINDDNLKKNLNEVNKSLNLIENIIKLLKHFEKNKISLKKCMEQVNDVLLSNGNNEESHFLESLSEVEQHLQQLSLLKNELNRDKLKELYEIMMNISNYCSIDNLVVSFGVIETNFNRIEHKLKEEYELVNELIEEWEQFDEKINSVNEWIGNCQAELSSECSEQTTLKEQLNEKEVSHNFFHIFTSLNFALIYRNY